MKLYIITLLIMLVGCGPSAQETKAKSPECLAATNQAAERKAKAESLDAEIKANNEIKRRELESLRLNDHNAELQGRPIKNRKAEALLESAIRANEIGLKHAPEMESLSTTLDQYAIQQACGIPQGKPIN